MTICNDLRQAVLQAAIQGKLTEQLPEDGSAADLLVSIKAEKEELVKAKKIKKEKPLAPISKDEIPFDVPDNWEWVTLCDIGSFSSGKTPSMSNSQFWNNGTINWMTSKDMKNKYLGSSSMKITELGADGMALYPPKTLLMVVRSGILKRMLPVCFLTEESTINQDIKAFSLFGEILPEYVYYMIKGLESNILLYYTKRTTTVDSLKFEEFSTQMPVPLPPLAEQQRIVARVDELMAKIDDLEKTENELVALKKAFPGDMKASLLQAAMQGKLTQQLPEDGSAGDLLASIKAEKEELVKAKKIKKEKPLAPISEDEIPFDIPDNWVWAHLGDLFQHNTGKALNATNTSGVNLEYITTSNLYWDKFELGQLRKMYFTEAEIGKCTVRKGDLLVCEGGDVGRASVWSYDYEMRIQNHIHRLRPYVKVNMRFFYYLFYLYKSAGWIGGKGIGIQGLSANALHTIVFPLPPLAEQKRIVEKLDKLLPLCDGLKDVEVM